MGISSTETNLGLKKILDEKQGDTTARTNVSLKGLSVDGTNDYEGVDIPGTPNGTAPYSAAEFRGYTQIAYTFNMRGSNSSEPGINKDVKAVSSVYDNNSSSQTARTDVYYYVYYRSNGNLAITAVSAITANDTFSSYRKWVNQSGSYTTLSGSAQMSEPGIEISGIASGYTVRFEVDKNEGAQTEGSGLLTASVLPSSLGSMTLSGDTFTHSGTASVPTQTSSQASAGTYPTSTRVKTDVDAFTIPQIDLYHSVADYRPAFRFIFEKSGEPTITIYCKAKQYAVASNII